MTITSHRTALRLGAAVAAVLLLTAAVAMVVDHGSGLLVLIAFAIGPDLALLAGAGRGLQRGQLHPRAVPLYNALHTVAGPVALGLLAIATGTASLQIAALAWGFHVALDRAVGYGLRTRDGFQRS